MYQIREAAALGEFGIPLHWHYFKLHSDPEWYYHLGSNRFVLKLFVFDSTKSKKRALQMITQKKYKWEHSMNSIP